MNFFSCRRVDGQFGSQSAAAWTCSMSQEKRVAALLLMLQL